MALTEHQKKCVEQAAEKLADYVWKMIKERGKGLRDEVHAYFILASMQRKGELPCVVDYEFSVAVYNRVGYYLTQKYYKRRVYT